MSSSDGFGDKTAVFKKLKARSENKVRFLSRFVLFVVVCDGSDPRTVRSVDCLFRIW